MAILGHIAYLLGHPMAFDGPIAPVQLIVNEAVLCCGALAATRLMEFVDKRPWSGYGLQSQHGLAHFGQGAFWGAAMLAAIMAVLYLTHAATITFSGASARSLLKSGLLWAAAFCLVAGTEEMTFRGFPFFRLVRRSNPVTASMVMSLLFGYAHLSNHGESATGIALTVVFGLVACLAVWRTGSLW